jgi:hypothetical protein
MAKKITKEPLKFPLNDAQLELLRAFSIKLRVSEQKELKKMLNDFLNKVAQARVDEAVEKGNWVKLQKVK